MRLALISGVTSRAAGAGDPQQPAGPPTIPGNRPDNPPHYRLGELPAYLRLGLMKGPVVGRGVRWRLHVAHVGVRLGHIPRSPWLQGCRVLVGFGWYIHGGIQNFRQRVCNPAAPRTGEGQGVAPEGGCPLPDGQKLRGSQRWLQVAVNRCPEVLDRAISGTGRFAPDEVLEWVSPLEDDAFREYRDQEFLDRLGVTLDSQPLGDFWPRRGPRWDGLARTSGGRCVLVEAKANLPEFNSDPSRASPASLRRIQATFAETKAFLKVRVETDWSRRFYQYANRIAHLYFLREVNKVDAVLVFLYFVGDDTRPGVQPVSREGWEATISLANEHLGLRASSPWLRKNVFDVFLDVDDLRHVKWP